MQLDSLKAPWKKKKKEKEIDHQLNIVYVADNWLESPRNIDNYLCVDSHFIETDGNAATRTKNDSNKCDQPRRKRSTLSINTWCLIVLALSLSQNLNSCSTEDIAAPPFLIVFSHEKAAFFVTIIVDTITSKPNRYTFEEVYLKRNDGRDFNYLYLGLYALFFPIFLYLQLFVRGAD